MAINMNLLLASQCSNNKPVGSNGKPVTKQAEMFSKTFAAALKKVEASTGQPTGGTPGPLGLSTSARAVQLQTAVQTVSKDGQSQAEVSVASSENDLGAQLQELLSELEEVVELLVEDAEVMQLDPEVVEQLAALVADLVNLLQQLVDLLQTAMVAKGEGTVPLLTEATIECLAEGSAEASPEALPTPGGTTGGDSQVAAHTAKDGVITLPMEALAAAGDAQVQTIQAAEVAKVVQALNARVAGTSNGVEAILASAQELGQKLADVPQAKVPAAVAVLLQSIGAKLAQVERTLTANATSSLETTIVPQVQAPDGVGDVSEPTSSTPQRPESVPQQSRQKEAVEEAVKEPKTEGSLAEPVKDAPSVEEAVFDAKLPQPKEGVSPVNPVAQEFRPLLHRIQQLQQVLARPVEPREVLTQVVERVQLMVADKQSAMELQLRPEQLGRLSLKISIEQGVVKAQFVAESQQVRQLIEANLTNLRHSLTNLGLQVDEVNVSVSQGEAQGRGERQGQEQGPKHRRQNLSMEEELAFEVPEYGAELDANSTIDYKV